MLISEKFKLNRSIFGGSCIHRANSRKLTLPIGGQYMSFVPFVPILHVLIRKEANQLHTVKPSFFDLLIYSNLDNTISVR